MFVAFNVPYFHPMLPSSVVALKNQSACLVLEIAEWSLSSFKTSFPKNCYDLLCLMVSWKTLIRRLLFDLSSPKASLVAQKLKSLPPMRETRVRSVGWEDTLEKEMATYSSTLAWRIPWTEKPGRQQSIGSHRVGHD